MLAELKSFPHKRTAFSVSFLQSFSSTKLFPVMPSSQWAVRVTVCDLIIHLFTWSSNFWLSWLLVYLSYEDTSARRLLMFFSQNRAVLLCGSFTRFNNEFLTMSRCTRSHTVTLHCSENKKLHSAEMKLKMLLHEQGFFFTETNLNSANMAKKLAYVPLFWMDNANKHLSLSHYSDVSQKRMGKLIEAKIVQKRTSTSGANEPSHENESLRLYLNGMLSYNL